MTAPIRPMAALDALRGLLAEQSHQLDPADRAFAALACACPDGCSCEADYPAWTPGVRPTAPKEATS